MWESLPGIVNPWQKLWEQGVLASLVEGRTDSWTESPSFEKTKKDGTDVKAIRAGRPVTQTTSDSEEAVATASRAE